MTKNNTFKRVMALMLVLVCVMSSVSVVGVSAVSHPTRHLRVYSEGHDAYKTVNYKFQKGTVRVDCVGYKAIKFTGIYASVYNFVTCEIYRSSDRKLIDRQKLSPCGCTYRKFVDFKIPKTGDYYFRFYAENGYEEILYMQWYNK